MTPAIRTLMRRELAAYFTTPLAYVFIVIFLALMGVFTFDLGQFFERGQADLQPFFLWHPWLYLFLVPALGMRLWAEERRSGTIELLLTLPVSPTEAVLGKYLAALCVIALSLALTFPVWISVNLLGAPDNTAILTGYLGSFLLAAGYLALCACVSALTRNQVIAFVLSVVGCFLFLLSDFPMVAGLIPDWAPQVLEDSVRSLSFLRHYDGMTRGVIGAGSLFFFLSFPLFWLYAGVRVIRQKQTD